MIIRQVRKQQEEDRMRAIHIMANLRVPDVDGADEEARELGYQIVHPITTEPWGVRRFLVRAPDGNLINVVRHRD